MPSDLAGKLLGVLDQLSGGVHPGFRPVHAKGVMFSGTFVPSPDAAELTRAPHASRPSTPVTVQVLGLGAASRPSPITPRRDRARRGWRPGSTWPSTSTPTSSPTRSTGSRHEPGRSCWSSSGRSAASGPGAPDPAADRRVPGLPPGGEGLRRGPEADPVELRPAALFRHQRLQVHQRRRPEPIRPVPPRPRCGDRVPDPRAGEAARRPTSSPPRCRSGCRRGRWSSACWCKWPRTGTTSPTPPSIWPETRQLVEFGTVTLTERVDELAPERRKIIFDPVPKVDGIDPSGDPLTEVRSDVYLLSGRRRRADAAK